MQNGAAPVKWGWWVNSPETFDPPLIALTSRDRKKTIALAFERAIWASSNTGDDRACFHLFPWFGRIEPGKSVTVRGRLYVLKGGPNDALKRFRRDFSQGTASAPRTIQLTTPLPPAISGHLGLGQTNAPGGRTVGADSQCLYRDGKPWIPVMGEFHYSRYPREEWRDALLKMKAGGINIVATYIFWIHHEEVRGQYDWTGRRSLREFLTLCRELDLLAVVRLGPWSHGEARNGGFPDWLQRPEGGREINSGSGAGVVVAPGAMGALARLSADKLRTTDPAFLELVANHYRQIAAQMEGLLWKDGGPVIGVQHDNESGDLSYLYALKTLARDCGIDVPFYTMTGWSQAVPTEELLPLFGDYADGFWTGNPLEFRDAFEFTPVRTHSDKQNLKFSRFPYLCCEIGGGMISSYDHRIHVTSSDIGALALVKLGSGNNLPGYYMYQGGINPEGKLSTLNETKATGYPNDLPVMDYDFGAPLGACGQLREHYHRLRQQHLFLHDFGEDLARMPACFPDLPPTNLDDPSTLHWSVRWSGSSGFLFFNNHQRLVPLAAKESVQFQLQTQSAELRIPHRPIRMASGAHGFWPVNLDCAGVRLDYATAQPLARLETDGEHWFFFTMVEGVKPEFAFAGESPRPCKPGTRIAFTRVAPGAAKVKFVVLTPEQGRQFWKLRLAGRDRVVLSPNALLPDDENGLRIETLGDEPVRFAVFPALPTARLNGRQLNKSRQGVFTEYPMPQQAVLKECIEALPIKAGAGRATNAPNAMDESAWADAAVWRVSVPAVWQQRDTLLRIHFVGDVARLYADGRLVSDHFYNGQPFDTGLWRIPAEQLDRLEIRVMPLPEDLAARLPRKLWPNLSANSPRAQLLKLEALERHQLRLELKEDPR
ncbi:MAG: beta-galactosidase [Verrucomicrobia bacterium]|nr:beta-galactosidase [Verrucomicrobiota bacterium]